MRCSDVVYRYPPPPRQSGKGLIAATGTTTFHTHFTGIVPYGVREHGVTSLADLGIQASIRDVDAALRDSFADVFVE